MRTPRPDRRVPPVLDVAFDELARRRAQQVRAQRASGCGVDERHRVLQLVAKAERAARLVEAAAPPEAAGQQSGRAASRWRAHRRRRRACRTLTAPRVSVQWLRTAASACCAALASAEALHAGRAPRPRFGRRRAGTRSRALPRARGRTRPAARRTDRARRRRGRTGAPARMAAGCGQRAVAAEELACGRRRRCTARCRHRRRRTRSARRSRRCRRCARRARRCRGRARSRRASASSRARRRAPIRRSR